MKKSKDELRSHRWLEREDFRSFNHRSRMMQMGFAEDEWEGKPIIGILNTWSDINPCHHHFKERVEDVKRGVYQAGGLPLELPCMSLFESINKPSALLYRNLLAMEAEELIRSYPIDGVILMGGCDKTTPGLLLGALSMNLPTIFIPAGPMLRGNYRGETLGSGSDAFKYWDEYRAGNIGECELASICAGISRSPGTCMTMGTASTMTSVVDAMGMTMPGASSIPAVDTNHKRMARAAGERIVELVWADTKPSDILTEKSFENGITVLMALGGSTNAIIHIIALARRAGIKVTMDDFDRISKEIPVIANIRPSGNKYVMEDFYFAGGVLGLMNRLQDFLHVEEKTVSGKTIGEVIANAEVYHDDVIRNLDNPVYEEGSLAVLKGNLAPNGCVMKPSAADPKFLKHRGPAIVFDDYASLKEFTDDENADVTENHIIILRNAGPKGGPGMPEWGMLPIPKKLLKQGVRDMVRISDARMSGTSYGSCILHVAPEAFVGGPLALVENGDMITIDVEKRKIHLEVSDEELAKRKKNWQPPEPRFQRGFGWMYQKHILQADEGCDFDFLETNFGAPVGEPEIN